MHNDLAKAAAEKVAGRMSSLDARRVFLAVQAIFDDEQADPEEAVRETRALDPTGQAQVIAALVELSEVLRQAREEARGKEKFTEQIIALMERAEALDHSVHTVGDAVCVLEAHGEPVGMSEEALEISLDVPSND